MSKLYFGVCPYGTICDVFINTLAGWSDQWLQPCTPNITSTGHLVHESHEQYVLNLTNNNPMSFRDIDWSSRLDEIELLLDNTKNRNVWIGNFHSKQARIIKKHFGNDAVTIGISYKPNMRKLVLENVVMYYHLHNEKNKIEYHIDYNTRYYLEKEKWDKIVPYSFNPDTDYSIDLIDFLNPDNYISFIESLDGKRNEQQLKYYFTWLARTKERLNEGY